MGAISATRREDSFATDGSGKKQHHHPRPSPDRAMTEREKTRGQAKAEAMMRWRCFWPWKNRGGDKRPKRVEGHSASEGEERESWIDYLGMVYLSPDSKSPATGNNRREDAGSIAEAGERNLFTKEMVGIEASTSKTADGSALKTSKKLWRILQWKKGIHGGVERESSREGLLTWRGTRTRIKERRTARYGSPNRPEV